MNTANPENYENHNGAAIAEIEGLDYTYPNQTVKTLDNFSAKIYENEIAVLVGKTGSGKTTFAMSLNGLIPQVLGGKLEGSISINGFSPSRKRVGEMATKVGLAFQDPDAQLFNLYVENEIAFGCENICIPREEIRKRVKRVSKLLGISHLRKTACYTLSTGQKHKAAIASVIAMEPQLLVLDEPLADLDPRSIEDLLECIDRLRKEGRLAVLVMEHKIDDIAPRANRILVLDHGRIIAEGNPRGIFEEYGEYMLCQLGIRIPQMAELAIKMRKYGRALKPLPLTPKEAFEVISTLNPQLKFPSDEAISNRRADMLLEIEELNFAYGNRSGETLRGINLKINHGEFIGLVGPNAAGKTTLAKNIVGLLRPNEGKISLEGKDICRMPVSAIVEKIGYVFQRPECQFVREIVKADLDFSISLVKKKDPKAETTAVDLLEQFELKDYLISRVDNLSRGQKRRLGIVSMLTLGQKALILDEPTTGQDWGATMMLMGLLKRLNKEKHLTVIIITHDMRVLAEWINRALVMKEGEILYDGKPRDLFANTDLLEKASLAAPPIVELSNLLSQNQAPVHSPYLTIEEFFEYVEFGK